MLTPVETLPFLALKELSGGEAAAVRNGRALAAQEDGLLRLVHDGALVAVGRGDGAEIRPETVLP